MKVSLIPSVSHARRACGKDTPMVVRLHKSGVVDMYHASPCVNPDTPQQQITRRRFGDGAARWSSLAPEQKEKWSAFARRWPRLFERPSGEPLTGNRAFYASAYWRRLLGLDVLTDPPLALPPPPQLRLELLPSAEDDTLRIRVEHQLKSGGLSLVVSMTPPTARPSRKPLRRDARYVKGVDVSSTAPLPEPGGVVTFTGCRFAVRPGERFGVWVRIIRRSSGLASPEVAADFIRPQQ